MDEPGDAADDGQERDAAEVIGLLGALAQGVRGWFTWCSNRIGSGRTYTLHAVAVWAAGYYSLWVTWAVVISLVLAVGLFIPHEPLDRLSARIEQLGNQRTAPADEAPTLGESGEPGEEAPIDPLSGLLWRLIGEAPGVHLKTLAEALARAAQAAGEKPPSRADVEAKLEALEIPLRASVRDARGKVNRGVHRDDLTAWERSRSPTEAPAVAEACSDGGEAA
ncbi:hypothetical protein [Streptomyces sp. NPDC020298]|uniref:hypothetical protein n=1 Tax=unclassified Streptomyces TaxID=2593676 RepID=UPI0034067CDF